MNNSIKNTYIPKLRFKEFSNEKIFLKKLDEIFILKNGYTPSKKNKLFWTNGNIPWFRIDDIRINGQILSDSLIKTTTFAIKKNGLFKKNSIILTTSATIGVHALITKDFLCNQRFTVFEIKKNFKINCLFSFYFFYKISNWCKNNISLSSFPSVQINYLKKYLFWIPLINEQNKIAKFFSLLDQQISSLETKLQLMEQKFKFFLNKLIKNKENKKIKLKNVCSITKGDQINISQLKSQGKYYYQNGGVEPSGWIDSFNRKENTISINEGGSCGLVKWHSQPFWSGGHLYTLDSINENINKKYLYYVLKFNEHKIKKLQIGTSLPNIQKKDLEKFLFSSILNLEKQNKISQFLYNLEKQKKLIISKILQIKNKKNYYIKNLFM